MSSSEFGDKKNREHILQIAWCSWSHTW